MYIPYKKIFDKISLLFPSNIQEKVKNVGYKLKMQQNLKYISDNKQKVTLKLKNKLQNNQKLKVAFYVYDETKWKSQSLYDLMDKSEYFEPYIFTTKNCAIKENFNYQPKEEIRRVYNFFKQKDMRVLYAYDFQKDNYIPFDKMSIVPDIIFYTHPWYVYKTQGPVMASEYALTYYVPYFITISYTPIEYYLRFHKYIQTHYVIDETVREDYSSKMENKGINLKAVGHPMLDYFYLNKNKTFEQKEYVIYAPHWSVDKNNNLRWGTFLQIGEKLLEYAKSHPELNWVYKPHPCLHNYLVNQNYFSKEEVKNYKKEWAKIGKVIEDGDYLDMFMQSSLMITDCGSFEVEYFMTQKPLIHLNSINNPVEFNPLAQKIIDSYYPANNFKELQNTLNEVVINKNDYKKDERENVYNILPFKDIFAAKNILEDILNCLK